MVRMRNLIVELWIYKLLAESKQYISPIKVENIISSYMSLEYLMHEMHFLHGLLQET